MTGPGYVKVGRWEFPSKDAPRVKVSVEFSAEAKVEKKEAKGKDDAKTTFSGAKPRDVKVTISWPEWEAWQPDDGKTPEDKYAREALKELNPTGPKAGEPWEITHVDAELMNVGSVMFEKLSLKREEGTNKIAAELSGASWVKPAAGAQGGKAKTPTGANAWTAKKSTVTNFGGIPGNTVTFGGQNPPTVKP